MTREMLAQITSDNGAKFVAGIVLWNDVVIEAAPIVGYMKKQRWTRDQVRAYCDKKGWSVSVIWQCDRRDIDDKGRAIEELRHGRASAD